MSAQALVYFAGGIGLFLLGMRLMTDGLRVSAGDALRRILAACTDRPVRGLGSGILVTALVQSSSAVTFATVGFVNAGLLTVAQAITVIYGANVGTTLTSWLVAVVGFNVNLQALALPAIALGMLLRLTGGDTRRAPLGDALAGFGLFFLGIDVLRSTFMDLGTGVDLAALALPGIGGVLVFLLVGILLTVLMQSSSAALALTLTAAAGGLITLESAAAVVIGANLGTTSTAVFAAIGATPNARRVAAAHVIFNAITALVALLLLPVLLWLAGALGGLLTGPAGVATTLAVFHTLTKLAGLLVVWPLTGRLVAWLEQRFRAQEEDLARTEFLDTNVLATPSLALDAIRLELGRTGDLSLSLLSDALEGSGRRGDPRRRALEKRLETIADYVNRLHHTGLPSSLSAALPIALRVGQYQNDIAQRAEEYHQLRIERSTVGDTQTPAVQTARLWQGQLAASVPQAAVWRQESTTETSWAGHLQQQYQAVKEQLLEEGSRGQLTARRMVHALNEISVLHRALEQMQKGAEHYRNMTGLITSVSTEGHHVAA
ncbi:MAG: Na/Pi symporter [Ectothiorhodospiraceae bacterium]|nr:Na/Pi cotransporter family protein [Paracoccaceae bacterium]MCH8506838.1 Na/Pi symporter [Ectothiorhodospiraceae bacterium]